MSGSKEFQYLNTSECLRIQNSSILSQVHYSSKPVKIEMWEAVVIIMATGFFAVLLAWAFSFIRKHVYKDSDNLDTSFDAGGNVNAGLTAATVVSQWTWAATLLQSSTVAAKYGISGSMWYAAGASIQVLLFSMLSVQLKIRAPGAKTFLQVIMARFGKRTHLVFCCFALATNVIVTAMLMLGGAAVITSLVEHISVEYAITLVTTVIGGYTFIGGLGATFYVSFFNTAIIYIVMLILIFTVYEKDGTLNSVGSISKVFDYVSCAKGPEGNKDFSYLTILSDQGLMFGLINIVGNFGTVFVDQSYWQSSVAAKPKQGVIGFLLGGLAWFAIPFSLSTTMGLAYVAMSAEQGSDLLSLDQINAGLVPPTVASRLLGKSGAVMILIMVLMAITSTGSAEVMAVTSIMVYDIYSVYLKPYRLTTDTNSCILCGKGRGRMANPRDKCECVSLNFCANCHADNKSRAECRRAIKPDYKCITHGSYRVYNDFLSRLKSWALVWVTMCIIPFTLLLYMADVGLGWVYLFMGVLVGSAVVPITLCMFWDRLTGKAMVIGSIGGTVMAVTAWIAAASTYSGGLNQFKENTGREAVMLCGNLTAIIGGGVLTIALTFILNKDFDPSMGTEIWENTRDIDNPLSPWTDKYRKELALTDFRRLDNRPSLVDVQKAFKHVQTLAYCMSIILSILLVFIWPAIMVAVEVMDLQEFTGWVKLSEVWAFLAGILIIFLPLANETWDIWSVFSNSKKVGDEGFLTEGPRKESRVSKKQSKPLAVHDEDRARTQMIRKPVDVSNGKRESTSSTMSAHDGTVNSTILTLGNSIKEPVESETDGPPFPSSVSLVAPINSPFNGYANPPAPLPANTTTCQKTNTLGVSVTLPSTMIDMGRFQDVHSSPMKHVRPQTSEYLSKTDKTSFSENASMSKSTTILSISHSPLPPLTGELVTSKKGILSPPPTPVFSISKNEFTNFANVEEQEISEGGHPDDGLITHNEALF